MSKYTDASGHEILSVVLTDSAGNLSPTITTAAGTTASAANVSAQSGTGAIIATPPGEWLVSNAAGVGQGASVSRAAGGAGVRHIVRRLSFGMSSKVAIAATTLSVYLRDGASGTGTVLWQWLFDMPATTIWPPVLVEREVNVVGSANTAMTLEFGAGVTSLNCYCNLAGYDAS